RVDAVEIGAEKRGQPIERHRTLRHLVPRACHQGHSELLLPLMCLRPVQRANLTSPGPEARIEWLQTGSSAAEQCLPQSTADHAPCESCCAPMTRWVRRGCGRS